MKYDKVTILGVAGCVLAFILLMYLAPRPQLPPPASNSDQQTTVFPDAVAPAGAAATAATDGTTPADPTAATDPAGAAAVAAPVVASPAGVPGAPRLWPDAAGLPQP